MSMISLYNLRLQLECNPNRSDAWTKHGDWTLPFRGLAALRPADLLREPKSPNCLMCLARAQLAS